jgi:hypothetical protein
MAKRKGRGNAAHPETARTIEKLLATPPSAPEQRPIQSEVSIPEENSKPLLDNSLINTSPEDAKFKWQDALGIFGVLLAVAGMNDMPVLLRVFCFLVAAVCMSISFVSHRNWSPLVRLSLSSGIFVFMILLSYFAATAESPVQEMMTALKLQDDAKMVVGISMACETNHIPLHIPANSSINVIRLNPAMLYSGPSSNYFGPFEKISASSDALDWPTDREGKWMTMEQFQESLKSGDGMPTPYASECTMRNYGNVTAESVVAWLVIDTRDKRRHSYPIPFDPLTAGELFKFYIVSTCTSGNMPVLVQWGSQANVKLIGGKVRSVPIDFGKTNFPSSLMLMMGHSSFVWSDLKDCEWKDPK